MRTLQLGLIVVCLALGGAACAKARASTEPVMPVLQPPPPPPRIVERYPDGPVPTIQPGPVDAALSTPPAKEPPRPVAKPEVPKPEPTFDPAPPPPAAQPSLTLKPAAGVPGQSEIKIRELLDQAQRDLQRVAYASLNADGRAQFGIARGFIQQSDEALKNGNLQLASKLADKAATMAALLIR